MDLVLEILTTWLIEGGGMIHTEGEGVLLALN